MRSFVVIWIGQMFSLLGTSMSGFGLTVWAYELTGSATALALVGFFFVTPMLIVSPLAGALVDRSNRKLMMMLSDLASGRRDHLHSAALLNRASANLASVCGQRLHGHFPDLPMAGFFGCHHHHAPQGAVRARQRPDVFDRDRSRDPGADPGRRFIRRDRPGRHSDHRPGHAIDRHPDAAIGARPPTDGHTGWIGEPRQPVEGIAVRLFLYS